MIMKNKFPAALAVVVFLLSGQHIFAVGTNDPAVELRSLVAQIRTKLAQGQKAEGDFAPELKQFDNLLAEHQGEKTDAVAKILYMKATLYGEVFGDTPKADALTKQLKTDFQGTQFVALIERQEAKAAESKKIQDSLAIGTKFPGFDEQDVNGKPISVSNYKGKVVMVDFWATWCGPCRGEIPNVVATYQKYHNKGFEIVGVSLDQDKQKLLDYTQQQNMAWPQFFDGQGWNNKLAVKYGIESIPASFLLDGNGNIIAKNLRGEKLEAAVAKAVAVN
jgi:thiol-disulfide isomerase/thioredoxin